MSEPLHGEYKVPNGKLVAVDLSVVDGRLSQVKVSGDFFLDPDDALDVINAALDGLSADTTVGELRTRIEIGRAHV
jgi:lipoate-protein ligase A